MAGGGFAAAQGRGGDYEGGVTAFVVITCLVAAMGGLLFGYDLGISGGVTSMDDFLRQFFPAVYHKIKDPSALHESEYCKYDNHMLTLFTSSLYLAALVASFFASATTRVFGRKASMFVGGISFLIGAILNGLAINIAMLIVGRLMLGVGVGFANQVFFVQISHTICISLLIHKNLLTFSYGIAVCSSVFIRNGTCKDQRSAQHWIPNGHHSWDFDCKFR